MYNKYSRLTEIHRQQFHRPQQSYTQGQLSAPKDGPGYRFSGQRRHHVSLGLLFRLSSVLVGERGRGKDQLITPFGTFCFVRMPEGLKNDGQTFTRMTEEVFKPQIGRNIQAYVDDLIVKSGDKANPISDLAETFANMRRAGLKLNPEKCVFGVTKGTILG
jgi:hypothetical protein